MRYIINESQKKVIGDVIMNFFDDNLTPDIPWDMAEKEIKLHKFGRYGYDLHLDDSGNNYYTYWNCQSVIDSLGEDHGYDCPAIDLPQHIYENLENVFGELWKPILIKWFNSKFKDIKINGVYKSEY
jgi:hypothetical protein